MAGHKLLDGELKREDEAAMLKSNGKTSNGKHDESHEVSDWGQPSIHNTEFEEGEEHERLLDPSFPDDDDDIELHELEPGRATSFDSEAAAKANEEDSPYEEVRAAVRNFDEDLPCSTIRAWTIGLSLTFVGAALNTLFSLRAPSIGIGPLIAQIVAWVMGRVWERVVPEKQVTLFGVTCDLNPGPFNIKEHSIIVVMASVSFSVAYATDVLLAQLVFYKQNFGIVFQLLIVVSTQSLGYGIAGIMRKFLVYPASMIWPDTLVGVALMNAMYETHHIKDPSIIGGSMSRYRWFGLIALGSCVYYFIPGFLAQFLSVTAVATWFAPQNAVVNQLFGGITGLSLIPITFDWTQVAGYIGSPLIVPWHAIANTLIGVVMFFLVFTSFLHYTGAWYSQFLPMSDASTYDNTGAVYNVSRILTSDYTLDEAAYKSYSPLFISTAFALSYGLSFAAITALVTHTFLYYSGPIWAQFRNSTHEKPDIHMKLMRKYKEAPSWWYTSLFLIVLALSLTAVLFYPTNLKWWAFLLAVAIAFIFSLPIGIIEAVTSQEIGLNVLTEFVYGYIQPGRPLALMLFKTYGFITMSQALRFVSDLKFGHYMKIPPRTMFMAQVVATTISCFIQVIVLNFALDNIDGVCDVTQPQRFTCPGGRTFFSASVIWGLIGPARVFSPGQIYSGLLLFFVLGAVTPVIIYFAAKRYPRSPVKYLMAPLIFGGSGSMPPATPLNYLSWGIVGYVFQFVIKRRHFRWWSRLNYLTSAGLDLGLAFGTLIIFFAFTLRGIGAPRWWGNNVVATTLDYQGKAVQTVLPPGETFGPKVW
ncbi:OPT oligopeptide transporter protein-domain-containing protein [Xylaria acuta]|nr:OPT oligopeptide transporter protein-domain-containing protein [Xylaria acuta]